MKAARPTATYQHRDRLNQEIAVDSIVAFCYSGGKRIHIGRVIRITKKRVRIHYTYDYVNSAGIDMSWTSDYQADPVNILVLNHIEQELTVLALKGVL